MTKSKAKARSLAASQINKVLKSSRNCAVEVGICLTYVSRVLYFSYVKHMPKERVL